MSVETLLDPGVPTSPALNSCNNVEEDSRLEKKKERGGRSSKKQHDEGQLYI